MNMELRGSEGTDEWATPREFFRPIERAVGGFDLDPASGAEDSPMATHTFDEEDDGLLEPWNVVEDAVVWCNPPYTQGQKTKWVEKCYAESTRPGVETVLCLVSNDTSTGWFHDHVPKASLVCLPNGRLRFGDAEDDAPFASILFVFGEVPAGLSRTLAAEGLVLDPSAIVSFYEDVGLDAFAVDE